MLRCFSRKRWPNPAHLHLRRLTNASQVYLDLERRGLVESNDSREQLLNHLSESTKSLYCGVDPTAPSLHVGHLLPLMVMLHFHLAGHKAVALVGGATGLVGDPSERDTARPQAHQGTVAHNAASLEHQLDQFFCSATHYASKRLDFPIAPTSHTTLNNASWHSKMSMLEFLSEVGNYSPLRTMLGRESVKRRLESKQGMMFTELTYQLLQAYDFYWLHRNQGCTIQIGGADQWGNILAGCDFIGRKLRFEQTTTDPGTTTPHAYGIVTSLLTTASGVKIGKSAGNAVWLDKTMTSIYNFYQYFLRIDDRDVASLLKKFTLLPLETIKEVMGAHEMEPEQRHAQRVLASEVTEMIHGKEAVKHAEATSSALFAEGPSHIGASSILGALAGDERLVVLDLGGMIGPKVSSLAGSYGLVPSKTAAKNLIKARGLYLNGVQLMEDRPLGPEDLIDQTLVVLRAGKTNHRVLALDRSKQPEGTNK